MRNNGTLLSSVLLAIGCAAAQPSNVSADEVMRLAMERNAAIEAGNLSAAWEPSNQLVELLRQSGDRRTLGRALLIQADTSIALGKSAEGLAIAEEAIAAFEAEHDELWTQIAHASAAVCAQQTYNFAHIREKRSLEELTKPAPGAAAHFASSAGVYERRPLPSDAPELLWSACLLGAQFRSDSETAGPSSSVMFRRSLVCADAVLATLGPEAILTWMTIASIADMTQTRRLSEVLGSASKQPPVPEYGKLALIAEERAPLLPRSGIAGTWMTPAAYLRYALEFYKLAGDNAGRRRVSRAMVASVRQRLAQGDLDSRTVADAVGMGNELTEQGDLRGAAELFRDYLAAKYVGGLSDMERASDLRLLASMWRRAGDADATEAAVAECRGLPGVANPAACELAAPGVNQQPEGPPQ